MPNSHFEFKQFTIQQDRCAMKVTTDACLFGGWVGGEVKSQNFKVENVLDIGTGTGLLSLMLVQDNPVIQIDAIEIDEEAGKQAKENILSSPWKNNITVITGDIRTYAFAKKYDAIISNPPFYEKELKSPDPKKNIAHHGNDLALTELFNITRQQLAPNGKFFFLLPYKRKKEIEQLLKDHSLFIHQLTLVKQSTYHDYFRIMIEGGLQENIPIRTTEISIQNENKEYTPEFIELLKDYYLYL